MEILNGELQKFEMGYIWNYLLPLSGDKYEDTETIHMRLFTCQGMV